ncbi:TAFII28-domain-containing protein [Artomyces pyxidatus]|uniref:TAFII28-domain-containing protein n=1 Tax=Artomyces pyxidatus TaxID=48021 RepID=A0ACB8T9J7_9AGAM|nr:TAFII28-domain-containing protein [Artomyces pyxidatus]
MTSPFTSQPAAASFVATSSLPNLPSTPATSFTTPNHPLSTPTPTRGRGAKRGRKPRAPANETPQTTTLRWTKPATPGADSPATGNIVSVSGGPVASGSGSSIATQAAPPEVIAAPGGALPIAGPSGAAAAAAMEKEEEGEDDEVLPAMADDDYSAQLSWQSQSKDNLKVLMDNFTPEQYERFEAYRRHALPKQAVRKVIQQALGQQVSQPIAQVVAGFSKVFVGEIVEKARAVQARRGETGPLAPDHLREAYRAYQLETGRVGAARPVRAKKLFTR